MTHTHFGELPTAPCTSAFFRTDEDDVPWPFIAIGLPPQRGNPSLDTQVKRIAKALAALQGGIEDFDAYLVEYANFYEQRNDPRAAIYRAVLHRFRECIVG